MVTFVLIFVTIVTMLMGMPIAFSLGISAFGALLTMGDIPLQLMAQKIYAGMDSFPLLCIPFFILAGELMSEGRITEALVEFSVLIIGRIRGGLALADILASMFFGGMTGSAIAESSALGSVMIPMMDKAGYDRVFAASVTSAAAVIGPIIPPSIPAVLYSLAAGTSIGALFMAGVVPGILLGLSLMLAAYIVSRRRQYPIREQKITFRHLLIGFRKVILALFLPVIIVGGIISGIFTATEASAVAVAYALVVTLFVTKQIKPAQLPQMLIRSGVVTAVVMIIVGTATIWGWVIAAEQIASRVAVMLTGFSPVMFLLIANAFRDGLRSQYHHRADHPAAGRGSVRRRPDCQGKPGGNQPRDLVVFAGGGGSVAVGLLSAVHHSMGAETGGILTRRQVRARSGHGMMTINQ
jgi:tripartite ATP-independent transporter DctM subunit